MANIYLTEQGSILRKTSDRLIVEKDNQVLLDVQCHKIDAVLIFGNVQVTTQAIKELFEHGIEMAILTSTGRLVGQISSPTPKNVELRLAQYARHGEPAFVLDVSRRIVAGKIQNGVELLRRFSYNHPDREIEGDMGRLEGVAKALESKNSVAELLGAEGAAAQIYFGAFGKMILKEFQFFGRRKRPATDPVNSLLSFGYTLVFNEIASLLDGIGFDPYIGFFHKPDYGRASLAADLVEEFRSPIVDRLTLKLINNRVLTEADFYTHTQSGAIYLKKETMKRNFVEYEKCLTEEFTHPVTNEKTDFRRCFRLQAQRMAAAIKQEEMYAPFHYDR